MDTVLFWSTFWGGVGSILFAAAVTGIVAFIWARVSRVLRARPAWILTTDPLGRTWITYNGRRPAYEVEAQVTGQSDPSLHDAASVGLFVVEPVRKGSKTQIRSDTDWNEIYINWRDSPRMGSTGIRPHADQTVELVAESSRTKLAHRLGRFLLRK